MDDLQETIVKPIAKKEVEIGIDTQNILAKDIVAAAQVGALDVSSIDALTSSAQNREQVYELLDSMAQDGLISSILEVYAEDAVQQNDNGDVIWIESSDKEVLEYTNWLLDTLNISKHLNQWAYCLVTYGDCYVRLFRKSDTQNDLLFKNNKHNQKLNEATGKKEPLNEEAKLVIYDTNDPYEAYVEMVPNPGEMFDLQKFGKCYGFIQAPIRVIQQTTDQLFNYLTRYKMKQRDVKIYDATTFVHACLENTTQRQPETVDIYLDSVKEDLKAKGDIDIDYNDEDALTTSYSVKRGQSILYNTFRIWRELNLLEMSALLNRITQSSVVRVLNVDVGDMPKEQVDIFLTRLKEKIEQKTALNAGTSMNEYNNPGPIINTIYVPTHNGQGTITATTIGGDFDPKSLTDIEYFRDSLFGSLKVPKQFFGYTSDSSGFNGGTSLTIISSRYGKTIKKIQGILCQLVTDIINLFLIDRGLNNYVNRFKVRMQPPVTQEELDRRANTDNRVRYIGDIMQQLTDVDDKIVKLNIYKSLISTVVNDNEVVGYIQEYIEKLEAEQKEQFEAEKEEKEAKSTVVPAEAEEEMPVAVEEKEEEVLPSLAEVTQESVQETEEKDTLVEAGKEDTEDSYLPSPEELGFDGVNNKKIEKDEK